jgi:predicted peroxiredoxin
MKTVILLSSGSKLELYVNEDNMKRILKPIEGVKISRNKIRSTTTQADSEIFEICRKAGIKGIVISKSGKIITLEGEEIEEQLSLFNISSSNASK